MKDRGATDKGPADRPKKQGTRMLKATCEGDGPCGYTVRLTAKWVQEVSPPHCPKHGAMAVDMPAEEIEGEA
jgi:2-keto-4-pentenoate hydratase